MSSNNNSSSAGIGFLGLLLNRLYRAETDKNDCVVVVVGVCSHLVPGAITILVFVVLLVREIVLILKRRAER